MTGSDLVLLVGAALLVLVAATLAGIDSALTRVSRVTVEEFVREGRPRAEQLSTIVADASRYLNLLLLLRVASEIGATSLVALVMVHAVGAGLGAVGLATLLMTLVSYIVIGVAFRTLGRQHAKTVALRSAGLTAGLAQVFGPLPRLLILLGNAITPGRGYRDGPFATEAELRDLVDLAEERGLVERGERDMIASVFELGDTLSREVMVPRPDMVFIEHYKTVEQALALALRSGFSRIPVVGDSIDDVVGVAFLKDLVRRDRAGRGDRDVDSAMRTPFFVTEFKKADDLLREMQARREHLGIVIDEYGGTAGLVTIEDVLEEIVGEITDEYDRERPPIERLDVDPPALAETPDGTETPMPHGVGPERVEAARVTARLSVEDLGELFDVELPDNDDVESVGGLLASELGRVPIPGATVEVSGLRLVAESAAGRRNRIGTVVVTRLPEIDPGENNAAENSERTVRG
jgi:CBS domain containing-hemolysin-like protein